MGKLKEEKVKLSDGTEVACRQISYAGQLRLSKIEGRGLLDILRESLGEQAKILEEINAEDGELIAKKVTELNIPKQEGAKPESGN